MVDGEALLRAIAPGVVAVNAVPVEPADRAILARRIGRKGAGLALLPAAWTPPFFMIEATVFEQWKQASRELANDLILRVAAVAAREARTWSVEWDRGITVRSSATEETLNERGANHSVELAADFDGAMIARAIIQVFERFGPEENSGAMALVVQARVAHLALGHISNELRVSKTVNHWMWEYEPAEKPGGRFNSQRDVAPNMELPLRSKGRRPTDLVRTFRKVGRWCTQLGAGRTHLEWGATADTLWLFQLDLEDDQPDSGVDPTTFLRLGDFRPSGDLPAGSPLQKVPPSGGSGWKKIDKVSEFTFERKEAYPNLIYITGDVFLAAIEAGYDLVHDLNLFAHGRIVCRTDCRAFGISGVNLPRTHTVTSREAVDFISATVSEFYKNSVPAVDLCFILHKFIPSVTAAWAVARRGDQIVRVDSLWGLPDGLQYLPHDSYEYDTRRNHQSSERPRYKHAFLQETQSGKWEVIRIARRATRWRSLPAPDLAYVAKRTHEIAERLGRDIQIMWFCQIPEETLLARNIPWFSMAPQEHTGSQLAVSPGKKRFNVRSISDLDSAAQLPSSRYLLQLDPDDPELFRSQHFLDKAIEVATDGDFPVGLTGSILSHAFYVLEKAGVSVVALNERSRSRTRQRRVFRKLVRDEMPERITEGGETVTLAEIAKEEARAALVTKLLEESYELLSADTPQEVTGELADMLEVVRSLAYTTGVDWADVRSAADQKRIARGSFEKSIVLLETSWPGWLAKQQQSPSVTIPLSSLGQVSEDNGSVTIPFALLLGSGAKPLIRLTNGTELEVSMDGNGVRIAPSADGPPENEQMSLPL